jgi:hypothetical protein
MLLELKAVPKIFFSQTTCHRNFFNIFRREWRSLTRKLAWNSLLSAKLPKFLAQQVSHFAARISSVVVTWSLLAVKVGTLNAHGVFTISLQAAVHPLTGPHTNKETNKPVNSVPYTLLTDRSTSLYSSKDTEPCLRTLFLAGEKFLSRKKINGSTNLAKE